MQRSSILIISVILLTAMFLLLPLNTPAQAKPEQVGFVVAVRGDVVAVDTSGDSRKLAIKSPVYREDVIKTGKRGRVQLMFTDNTLISLDRQTEMKIAEYEWKPEKNDGALKTEIKEGTFRVMGGKITKVAPDKFTTETPAATIGIRGSMYAGKVAGDSLSVVFQGGKGITVTNDFGSILITKPGYGTNVKIDTPPLPPTKFTAEDLAELSEQTSGTSDEQSDTSTEEQTTDQSGTETTTESSGTDSTSSSSTTTTTSSTSENTAGGGTSPPVEISPDAPKDLPDTATSNVYQNIVENELGLQNLPTVPSTTTPPINGIEGFKGNITGTGIDPDGNQVIISGNIMLEVNWHSKRVLGRVIDKNSAGHDMPVFFFGEINNNNEIFNVRIIGPGGDDSSQVPSIISGTSPYAHFYGSSQEAFGLYGAGTEYLITTLASQGGWTVTGTGMSTGIDPSDTISPTGTQTWKGFMVGAAEDVTNPDLNRRLYMSGTSNPLTLILNKDAGTVSGTATVYDPSATMTLSIGGGNGSAYVLDDNFIGLMTGSVTNVTTASLDPYFNYLVTADPGAQDWFFGRAAGDNEYASWGYWEAAYMDPQSAKKYHAHVPYSTWVAGDLTPSGVLTTPAPSATYTGGALGFHALAGGGASDLGKGTCSFNVNFSGSGADIMNGRVYFPTPPNSHPAVDIRFDNMFVTANPFQQFGSPPFQPIATVNGAQPNSSEVNGAFYGPVGAELGGNFKAEMPSGDRYMGIFGARKH